MDFASPFFAELIEFAKSPNFKGEYASLCGPESGTLSIFKVRWQDDQGIPRWDALLPVFVPKNSGQVFANPGFFGSLLRETVESPTHLDVGLPVERQEILKRLESYAHSELARRCSALRHPNDVVLLAAVDITSTN